MNHLHDESTGGPAFPAMEVRTDDTQDLVANASQGMTLRDWFAGQAMQAILTRKSVNGNELAVYAYQKADAMLAERIAARPSMAQVAKNKILQLREQGFTDYPVVATLQNGMHVCTVDNFGAVRWFSVEQPAVPVDYKLVPIEPTQAMIDATQMLLVGARDDQGQKHGLYGSEARNIYKLMVGAFHASE